MFKYIVPSFLLFFSSLSFAIHQCGDTQHFNYPDQASALAACHAYGGTTGCANNTNPLRYTRWSNSTCEWPGNSKQITFQYNGCPEGTEPNPANGYLCEEPPPSDCSETSLQGDIWNSVIEQCVCPAGQTDILGPDGYRCAEESIPPPECTADDPAFKGYMNNTPVCDWDEQCPDGHNGGLVDGSWRCIPIPPECQPGQLYVNGYCIGPGDDGEEPGDPGEPGDGEGEGNESPDNFGDDGQEGEGSFAQASPSCDVRPSCDGNAEECAILLQSWYNSCRNEKSEFGTPIQTESTDSWFESDYPDGFTGIWESKRSAVEQGAMVSWLGSWGIADNGTCPTFNFDMNLGFINFGSGNLLSEMCYIFDFIRLVILITAAFCCRALIFGG